MQVDIPGSSFYRDTSNMALINRDVSGMEEYKNKRRFAELQRQEINNIKNEFESIKSEIVEIKQLMIKLLEKGTNG